ncbi:MAG: GNAT family N-acetyltransferase [Burkholderiaceae bacterium]
MDICALTPADAPAFQTLRLQGLKECPSAFASSFEEEEHRPIEKIAERLLRRANGAIFGAFVNDGLVAVVGLQRESARKLAHKAFIWGMYVSPESRGAGVGRALLRHALQYAEAELGVLQVNLGVNTENPAAIALYKALGFKEFGVERDFLRVGSRLYDEYRMVCKLDAAPDTR